MKENSIKNLYGRKIRELRKAINIPARVVEQALGLPHNLLYKYENGTHTPSLGRAEEIAQYYGTSLGEIIRTGRESESTSLKDFIGILEMFVILLKHDRRSMILDSLKGILAHYSNILPQTPEVVRVFQKTRREKSAKGGELSPNINILLPIHEEKKMGEP